MGGVDNTIFYGDPGSSLGRPDAGRDSEHEEREENLCRGPTLERTEYPDLHVEGRRGEAPEGESAFPGVPARLLHVTRTEP